MLDGHCNLYGSLEVGWRNVANGVKFMWDCKWIYTGASTSGTIINVSTGLPKRGLRRPDKLEQLINAISLDARG